MPASITFNKARSTLAWVWAGTFLILLLVIPSVLLVERAIEPGDHVQLVQWVDKLSATYVPHLGVILAYYFSTTRKSGQLKHTSPFYLAIAASCVWNVTMLALVVPTIWGGTAFDTIGDTMQGIGSRLTWLTAPALGYFFGKSS